MAGRGGTRGAWPGRTRAACAAGGAGSPSASACGDSEEGERRGGAGAWGAREAIAACGAAMTGTRRESVRSVRDGHTHPRPALWRNTPRRGAPLVIIAQVTARHSVRRGRKQLESREDRGRGRSEGKTSRDGLFASRFAWRVASRRVHECEPRSPLYRRRRRVGRRAGARALHAGGGRGVPDSEDAPDIQVSCASAHWCRKGGDWFAVRGGASTRVLGQLGHSFGVFQRTAFLVHSGRVLARACEPVGLFNYRRPREWVAGRWRSGEIVRVYLGTEARNPLGGCGSVSVGSPFTLPTLIYRI